MGLMMGEGAGGTGATIVLVLVGRMALRSRLSTGGQVVWLLMMLTLTMLQMVQMEWRKHACYLLTSIRLTPPATMPPSVLVRPGIGPRCLKNQEVGRKAASVLVAPGRRLQDGKGYTKGQKLTFQKLAFQKFKTLGMDLGLGYFGLGGFL